MAAVKDKISRALQSNSSRHASGRAGNIPTAGLSFTGRAGSLRVAPGIGGEEFDEGRHLGELSLDGSPVTSSRAVPADGTADTTGIANNVPAAAGVTQTEAPTQSGIAVPQNTGVSDISQVIDKQIFTRTEDRQVVMKIVTRELHHRFIEKQYLVQTRYVGATRVAGGRTEFVGTEARQIEERVVEAPSGDRAFVIENIDVPREAVQADVVHLARQRSAGLGTISAAADTPSRPSVTQTSTARATTGATAGGSATTTSRAGGASSIAAEAIAKSFGKPYTISQPGTVVEEADQIIDSHIFTKTEDHQVVVEVTRYELHHRPVQKQYMVQTRYVGEQRVPGRPTEFLGTEIRQVEDRLRQGPTGDRTVVVRGVDVSAEEAAVQRTTAGTPAGAAVQQTGVSGAALPGSSGQTNVSASPAVSGSSRTMAATGRGPSDTMGTTSRQSNSGSVPMTGGRGEGTSFSSVPRGTTGTVGTTGVPGGGPGVTGATGSKDSTPRAGISNMTPGPETIVDSKRFTKTEDHQVLVEKKAYELQHHPVEKQYVVETRYVGEQRVPGAPTELVGTEARQVEEHVVEAPHGDRKVIIENVDVPREALRQDVSQGMPSRTSNFQ